MFKSVSIITTVVAAASVSLSGVANIAAEAQGQQGDAVISHTAAGQQKTTEAKKVVVKSKVKATPMYIKGKKITNCAQLVRYYRPSHLPKKQKFTVKCVNRMPSNNKKALAYISFYTQNKGSYAKGPFTIVILDKTNVPEMKNSFDHEAWHAVSYNWSQKKQEAFLKSLKAKSWTQGNVYKKMPAERWAWAATACYTTYKPYKVKADMNLVPGGCKGVRSLIVKK